MHWWDLTKPLREEKKKKNSQRLGGRSEENIEGEGIKERVKRTDVSELVSWYRSQATEGKKF